MITLGDQQNPNISGILYNIPIHRSSYTVSHWHFHIFKFQNQDLLCQWQHWHQIWLVEFKCAIFEWTRTVKRKTFLVLYQGLYTHKSIVRLRKTDKLMEKSSQYTLKHFPLVFHWRKNIIKARKCQNLHVNNTHDFAFSTIVSFVFHTPYEEHHGWGGI